MRAAVALAVLVAALLAALPARAAEWGLIVPGTSTKDAVRERYGGPTRVERPRIEGHDTEEWLYEGAQAPPGIARMLVQFGLLGAGGYRPDVVRAFRLEPRPGAFNRNIVVYGWGPPDRVAPEGDEEIFFYQEGLLVYLKEDGDARLLIFTVPQPPVDPPAPRTP